MLAYVDIFNQGDPFAVRLCQIPCYTDVEVVRVIDRLGSGLFASSSLRNRIHCVVVHWAVALTASIQSCMTTVCSGTIARVEQSVQLIVLWFLDAENQEPSVPLKVRHPFQAVEVKVESADCSSPQRGPQCFEEGFPVLCLDLQRPR